MKSSLAILALAAGAATCQAATVDLTDNNAVQTFQAGLTVVDFESVPTRTPQAVADYSPGQAVADGALVFDQIPGLQMSVGGTVGVNRPALFNVGADAKSGTTVLGPVDFDGTTKFDHFIEVFFPTKVAKVGFWVNPSLGPVFAIAADTNFAFSGLPETSLETLASGPAGHFVGFERAAADIGGLKIFGFNGGFTVDDFSFGPTGVVPEPGGLALAALGLGLLGLRRRS